MGVGLRLAGLIGARLDDPIAVIERFFRHRFGDDLLSAVVVDDERGGSVLYAKTHPAAEDVEVALGYDEDDGESLRRLVISAKTSTVGPGYHADLCEAIAALGEGMNVAWDPPDEDEEEGDDTGYFFTRDRAALEQEMLRWLHKVVHVLDEKNDDASGLQLSMPIQPRYHGPAGAAVLTQLGPRDRAWILAVKADPRAGIDVFPWWQPGRGAAYELGRVLVHLWLDARFRRACTDEEERLGRDLLARLGRAYRLDPALDYPWAAWELLHDDVIGAKDDELSELVRERAASCGENHIGYREHDVDVTLAGGWHITVPGSFSVEMDERGTWSAWEDGHTVWATAFSRAADVGPIDPAQMLPAAPREGTPVVIAGLSLLHRAHERSFVENGETFWQVCAEIAAPGRMLLLTAVVPEQRLLPWAHKVIASTRA